MTDSESTADNTSPEQHSTDQLISQYHPKLDALQAQIKQIIIGQDGVVEQLLITLLSSGHLLLEGVPGLGKTLLIQTVAGLFNAHFKRIQFTPDLMPADVTGHTLYDMQEGKFRIRRGPIFTQFLLADEINRAPAKTQAALLEVMQERQVTIEGESLPLKPPFMVMATQNPLEQEGTYPLPEAELDRFLLKVVMGYPSKEDEIVLTNKVVSGEIDAYISHKERALFESRDVLELQALCAKVTLDQQIVDYAVRIVRSTRETPMLMQGAGPRAAIGLAKAARAKAMLGGRDFVLPDDVKALVLPVLRHRVTLSAESEIDGLKADDILLRLLENIEAPR